MKTYNSIHTCIQYFAWLGFRATEAISGGGSNSEDFFVLLQSTVYRADNALTERSY